MRKTQSSFFTSSFYYFQEVQLMAMRIKVNKIRCNKCGEIIESKSVHDFKFCKCGAVAVDGGKDYLRRCGNREDWEGLSEVIDDSRE